MEDKQCVPQSGACGCGRSPTGKCMGWHAFTDEEFANAKRDWQIQEDTKRMFGIPAGTKAPSQGT